MSATTERTILRFHAEEVSILDHVARRDRDGAPATALCAVSARVGWPEDDDETLKIIMEHDGPIQIQGPIMMHQIARGKIMSWHADPDQRGRWATIHVVALDPEDV